ncbi:MAG: hypothetical protein AAGG75_21705 [Bacteroidota bacterium]
MMTKKPIINPKEELPLALQSAAETEQHLLCTYLYAAASLKKNPDQFCNDGQLTTVKRWHQQLHRLALRRGQNVALLNALLLALEAPPRFCQPPSEVIVCAPFSLPQAQRMVCLEAPNLADLPAGMQDLLQQWSNAKEESLSSITLRQLYQNIKDGFARLPSAFCFSPKVQQADLLSRSGLYLPAIKEVSAALHILEIIAPTDDAVRPINAQRPFLQLFDIAMEYQMLTHATSGCTRFVPHHTTTFQRDQLQTPYTLRLFDLFNYTYITQLYMLTGLYGWYRLPAEYPHLSAALREIAFDPISQLLVQAFPKILQVLPVDCHTSRIPGPNFQIAPKEEKRLIINACTAPNWARADRYKFYQNIEFYVQRLDRIIGEVQQLSEQHPQQLASNQQRFVRCQLQLIQQDVFKMADDLRRVYQTGVGSRMRMV